MLLKIVLSAKRIGTQTKVFLNFLLIVLDSPLSSWLLNTLPTCCLFRENEAIHGVVIMQ